MHSYMRAVGFSNLKSRAEIDKIIGIVMNQPTEKYVTHKNEKVALTEISRDFAERMGVTIRGEYDEKGFFHLEHYFPHFRGQSVSTKEDVMINKKVDTESYTGMCDDYRLGVSLIFYLQNVIDFIDKKKSKGITNVVAPIMLSGLSIEGRILLGIEKCETQKQNKSAEFKQRSQLIAEARKGDQDAIDSLTIDDIDLYAMISRRAKNEDVYSIVESTFVPYGSESDNYSVIGTILDWNLMENSLTKELIYDLLIECNDIIYNICINKTDLMGEPAVGRRFKGNIWMQGLINFME